MARGLLNLVLQSTATVGTGTLSLGAAYQPSGDILYLTAAQAGAVDGDEYVYLITEGADFELGYGIYTASGTTLTRATVIASKIAGVAGTTKMNLAGGAVVGFPAAADSYTQPSMVRLKLTADRTYYVRADGSDTNSGLVNNSGGAFLTIQKAIDVIYTIDLGGFAVTIQVDAGTYTNDILLARPFIGGEVTLQGDLTTPSNVVISHNAFAAFAIRGTGTALKIGGFRVQNSAGSALGQGIYISSGAALTIVGAMEMHTCTRSHFEVVSGSLLAIGSNYSFTGNAPIHWQLDAGEVVLSGYTITSSGSRAFSSAFLAMTNRAGALIYNLTKSGSATGPRYTVTLNSVCNVFGAGTSALFGNAAHGTPTATGGQYV